MPTSRQRLFDYIRSQQAVTAADLSRALKMTAANARHHLNVLEQQGLVQVVGERAAHGRGRPAKVYSLSQQAQGDNLDRLACAALEVLLQGTEGESQPALLDDLARRLAFPSHDGDGQRRASMSRTARLYAATQRLNEMHYQARWEAHAEGPQIILGRCPYAAILHERPELCRLDERLLGHLVGGFVELQARMARDSRGQPYCLFQLRSRS